MKSLKVVCIPNERYIWGVISFGFFPPVGALKFAYDVIQDYPLFTTIQVESINNNYKTSKLNHNELESLKKKIRRGDYARLITDERFNPELCYTWGKVWKVRIDGFIDIKFILSENKIIDVMDNEMIFNPRRLARDKIMISSSIDETQFRDIGEIYARPERKIEFNYQHALIYSIDNKCSKCGKFTFVLDINQWNDIDGKEFRCLDCLPENINNAIDNVGTKDETLLCQEHLDLIYEMVNLTEDNEDIEKPDLPTTENFDMVDELDSIISNNTDYKGYK